MSERVGRPRASSRATIAEAACELFLERGYDATTTGDIARRAGVARSSFFAYFPSKADVVWSAFDERLELAATALATTARVDDVLRGIGDGFAPEALALALAQAGAMRLITELEREQAVRQLALARAIAARLRADGAPPVEADVRAATLAGAVFAALHAWAGDSPGRASLGAGIARALDAAGPVTSGDVRQLRLVVRAEDWDAALAFYRDVAGMPVEESYEADGGARVVILGAGRATLELSNPEQVAFIDRVETDGDAPSDRMRVALEVDDARRAAARLAAGGAVVEASARETPWRSVNARLRAPGDLQLTLFQELGPGSA